MYFRVSITFSNDSIDLCNSSLFMVLRATQRSDVKETLSCTNGRSRDGRTSLFEEG